MTSIVANRLDAVQYPEQTDAVARATPAGDHRRPKHKGTHS